MSLYRDVEKAGSPDLIAYIATTYYDASVVRSHITKHNTIVGLFDGRIYEGYLSGRALDLLVQEVARDKFKLYNKIYLNLGTPIDITPGAQMARCVEPYEGSPLETEQFFKGLEINRTLEGKEKNATDMMKTMFNPDIYQIPLKKSDLKYAARRS